MLTGIQKTKDESFHAEFSIERDDAGTYFMVDVRHKTGLVRTSDVIPVRDDASEAATYWFSRAIARTITK